jgi:fatty acid-binding protein DegV
MLTVSNVNQLKKGGRLNEFAASAIKLLNLKIIIFLDNKGLYLFKCCKTIDKAIKSVFKHFKKENDNFDPVNSIKRIAILKSPTFTLTKEINDSINDLKKICKNKTNFYVDEIPGIICAHTGAESFALYFELY